MLEEKPAFREGDVQAARLKWLCDLWFLIKRF